MGTKPESTESVTTYGERGRLNMLEAWKLQARKLKRDTYALYLACRDPRTPWYAKVLIGCVAAYAFSPVDLIPDFIPVLGYLDDLVLVPLGIALAIRMVPPDVLAEYRAKAEETLGRGRPRNWAAGAVIIGIWGLLAVLAVMMGIKIYRGAGG